MKSPAGSVLRMASSVASPIERRGAGPIQDLVNRYFWTGDVSDQDLGLVLRALALRSSVADFTVDDVDQWRVGYMRRTVSFGSKRHLNAGDVILFNNLDNDGNVMSTMNVWGPRLMHVGLVDEDCVDPL